MSNSFADELAKFSKSRLKPTETRISYASGRTFVKPIGSNDEKEVVEESNSGHDESNVVYWSRQLGYLVDLKPDLSIDEIVSGLFLSGDDVAQSRAILSAHNITHVLNLTSNVSNLFESENIAYKKILVYDLPEQNIDKYFDEAFEFIDEARESDEKNAVLVHCNAGESLEENLILLLLNINCWNILKGVSRSASFVIAYLMKKNLHRTFVEAHDYVKSKRSKICPNEGFRKQLRDLEKRLNHDRTCSNN